MPENCQWAYFLRNHDELDLSRLTEMERTRCFQAFGPKKNMQLYNRGIRRRLAPMLGGDMRRQLLGYSLIFTMPGTPVLWYGEEIGMGDDLLQEERNSVRTPMQWNAEPNAGFAPPTLKKLRRPVIKSGEFDYRRVNVQAQRRDPHSLLNSLERMIRTRKEYPEFGCGKWRLVESDCPDQIFAHACEEEASVVLAVHNLSGEPQKVNVRLWADRFDHAIFLFGDLDIAEIKDKNLPMKLPEYGYNWIRLRANQMK